ncbi:Carbamoyltransferase [Desulfonatronospira thiodismutans ASO3-1]|uniref:Carbamoyltransferase n=1 Tax=Desulfonatronospira thiodismutans ASO3-1 TaxID=555779 RepID=D6SU70_9BACT|nr:carbamoyltransferase N-terminal domain-containing protein [Desulfonatronospira thiodismutans]EFI32850.1 Carbamoyltransferase [Desulfonatronospira thiodismutans ASO3-1]
MIILGISALYHDSAAAIIDEHGIIAAVQEERFSRKKHDFSIPVNSIEYCLNAANIKADELDAVIYYENPVLSLDRIIKTAFDTGHSALEQSVSQVSQMYSNKLWLDSQLRSLFGCLGKNDELLYAEHHMAHAASAFFPSPFSEAAIVTIDGVGEWATTTIGCGHGNIVELFQEVRFPHSIGLLYSAFTMYCGFKVNSGEYKLMGLAPYGNPTYCEIIKDNLIDIKDDGSFRLNVDYIGYLTGDTMINDNFRNLFGGPERKQESEISSKYMDIAASIQKVTEEVVFKLVHHARTLIDSPNLVMAGGVALNCVANGKVLGQSGFDNMWIQPASGDAGGALGAAYLAAFQYFNADRIFEKPDSMKGCLLGPSYTTDEIVRFLDINGAVYHSFTDEHSLNRTLALELEKGKIAGIFRGRMEYGPRALGNRSVIGDPRKKDIQSTMNLKIKHRESFRPFAPSVLAEDTADYFDLSTESPYMLIVAPVSESRRHAFDIQSVKESQNSILAIVNTPRSDIPAVTHVDFSARVHTVDYVRNPRYHALLKEFKEITGCSVLVNTSFNVRGEPIVCTPEDAFRCFMRTDMDILVLENTLLFKYEQNRIQTYYYDEEIAYELD